MKIYPYLQIASVLRATILRGDYVPGQRMPPIRDLAQREGRNPATVQKKFLKMKCTPKVRHKTNFWKDKSRHRKNIKTTL